MGWQLVLILRDAASFRGFHRIVVLGGLIFTVVRDCFSVWLVVGLGRKAPLPSVGFVSVGSASALQCLPRSGGGIKVFKGSDIHYMARCRNQQSVNHDNEMGDISGELRKSLIGTGYIDYIN